MTSASFVGSLAERVTRDRDAADTGASSPPPIRFGAMHVASAR
jgi:hypothetical protein